VKANNIKSSLPFSTISPLAPAPTITKVDSFSASSTLRPGEVEKFERMSDSWWDPEGIMKGLFAMNCVR
jgi:hypothetical protein